MLSESSFWGWGQGFNVLEKEQVVHFVAFELTICILKANI
jgi:hypothetical protein